MTKPLGSLWSDSIRVTARSPLTILRLQADYLEKTTKGLLEGLIDSDSNGNRMKHSFQVVAPAADGYRKELLSVTHDRQLPYPATFLTANSADPRSTAVADTDLEFVEILEAILSSPWVTRVILALIARSNEGLGAAAPREDEPPATEAGDERPTPEAQLQGPIDGAESEGTGDSGAAATDRPGV
jgi:hypothetical protein